MKAYIFDFDGTLADSQQCSVLATQAAFKELKLSVPKEEQISYYMGIPIEQSFKEMADQELTNQEFITLLTVFREKYKELEEETLRLFPGMEKVLKELSADSARLFVLSSKKTDVLVRNLHTLAIDSYFTDCLGSDRVEHYKPHPDGIQKILEKYQLDQAETVMIGDAVFDIQMGKSAGCKTCAVTWGSHSEEQLRQVEPDFCLYQVEELLNLEKA